MPVINNQNGLTNKRHACWLKLCFAAGHLVCLVLCDNTPETLYTNTCIESLLLRCCNARCAPHFWLNSTVCVWLCVTVNRSRVYVCEQAVCLGQNRVNRTTLQVVGNLGSADLFYCVCFGIPNQTTNRSTQCVHSLTHFQFITPHHHQSLIIGRCQYVRMCTRQLLIIPELASV